MRFLTHRPIFLSHMVTSRCDSRCITCAYWKLGNQPEMSTEEIKRMLEDAREFGMTDYVVWGGEPLLRPNLPEIVGFANRLGLDVTMITNGIRLSERIDEFARDLYGLIVSIDHPDPERNDRIRGRPGAYEAAVAGVKAARRYTHLNIFINCVISRANADGVEGMAELAKKLGVKISFEMMEVVKGYNEHLKLSPKETADVCRRLIALKRSGYPISNSYTYFKCVGEQRPYRCHVPKVVVTVQWNGKIRVCSTIADDVKPELEGEDLGDVRRQSFREIFRTPAYEAYVRAAERCHRCDLSYPREVSLMYSLNPEALRNFVLGIL
jgi:MoaA/NifB/PqqE/SkfB family radical SAM enzyme